MSHSRFSPSSYSRWSACPGVLNLIDSHPEIEERSSVYSDEGTKMHTLAAKNIVAKTRVAGNPELNIYLDYCRELFEQGDTEEWVETKIQLPDTEIFGTADYLCYNKKTKTLHVVDLKWGQGVGVDIFGNTQLRIYALMALHALSHVRAHTVEITIVQPRFPHSDGPIRSEVISTTELLEFETQLLEAVEATQDKNAKLIPGPHCRWCKVEAVCPAIRTKAVTAAKQAFEPVEKMPGQKLSETLQWLSNFESWIQRVREHAYKELCRGNKIPGFKLVAKRAHRKWIEENPNRLGNQIYKQFSVELDDIFEKKLRSPAQIEKLLSPEERRSPDFLKLFNQESSGYTVAPEDDKRPEVSLQDASQAFTPITDETEGES